MGYGLLPVQPVTQEQQEIKTIEVNIALRSKIMLRRQVSARHEEWILTSRCLYGPR